MKKGFTLIELLAVIVILAIVALISVPIVLNLINDAKNESDKRSKELYLHAVELAIAKKNLINQFNPTSCTVESNGNLTCDGAEENLIVEVSGKKPCKGTITIENWNIVSEDIGYCDGSNPDDEMQGDEPQVPPADSFENDDWATIIANVKAGTTDKYEVGDTKEVTLTGDSINGTYTVRIANKTDNEDGCGTDGFSETACGFVIEFVDIITTHNMNSTATNVGGWESSAMREYLNVIDEKDGSGTIYNALPDEIKDGIKDTKVISGHGSGDTSGTATNNNFETTDKLYLLSPHEVWENGSSNQITYDTAWENTRQLDYYKGQNVTTSSYGGAIKKNTSNSASYWWLRSARSTNTNYFYSVTNDGEWNFNFATSTVGVAPAFRIG